MWSGRDLFGAAERSEVAARVRALLGESVEVLPVPPGRPRWQPSRAAVFASLLVVAVIAIVSCWWYFASTDPVVPVAAAGVSPVSPGPAPAPDATSPSAANSPAAGSSPAAGTSSSGTGQIVVDVAGRVLHPGIYRLAGGARVVDAVEAAGGVTRGRRRSR